MQVTNTPGEKPELNGEVDREGMNIRKTPVIQSRKSGWGAKFFITGEKNE